MTSPGIKIGAGVAGGYLLGRRRKMRLAVGLGAYLLGKKITTSPTALLGSALRSLQELPEFAELGEAVRGELSTAGRKAAGGVLTQRLDALADTLSDRTQSLEGGGEGGGKRGKGGKRDAEASPEDDYVDDRQRDDYDEDADDRQRDDYDEDVDDRQRDDHDEDVDDREPYPDDVVDVRDDAPREDAPRDEGRDRDEDLEPVDDAGAGSDTRGSRGSSRRRREPARG